MMVWKSQNRRALSDVELCTSPWPNPLFNFNIMIVVACFTSAYPHWTITSLYENTMSSISLDLGHRIKTYRSATSITKP
jgi:hypothetical protein